MTSVLFLEYVHEYKGAVREFQIHSKFQIWAASSTVHPVMRIASGQARRCGSSVQRPPITRLKTTTPRKNSLPAPVMYWCWEAKEQSSAALTTRCICYNHRFWLTAQGDTDRHMQGIKYTLMGMFTLKSYFFLMFKKQNTKIFFKSQQIV